MSARKAGGWTIVLTSDRGSFSEYSRSVPLGYFACMPAHVVPRLFMDRLFTPPVETAPDGEATVAPYALRKVEGALHAAGLHADRPPVQNDAVDIAQEPGREQQRPHRRGENAPVRA